MVKFKVGDKVKCIGSPVSIPSFDRYGVFVGQIVTVSEASEAGKILNIKEWEKEHWGYQNHWFEHTDENVANIKSGSYAAEIYIQREAEDCNCKAVVDNKELLKDGEVAIYKFVRVGQKESVIN